MQRNGRYTQMALFLDRYIWQTVEFKGPVSNFLSISIGSYILPTEIHLYLKLIPSVWAPVIMQL